jgi:hypothetical protein
MTTQNVVLERVRDVPDGLTLVDNDWEVEHVLDHIGVDNSDNHYRCLFVGVSDGEYTEVWATRRLVPALDANAYRLY